MVCSVDIRKGTKYGRGRRSVTTPVTESVGAGHLRDTLSAIDDDMPELWHYLSQLPDKQSYVCLTCTNKLMQIRRAYGQQDKLSSHLKELQKDILKGLNEMKSVHMTWKRPHQDSHSKLQPSHVLVLPCLQPAISIPSPSSSKTEKMKKVPFFSVLPMMCDSQSNSNIILVS